MASPDVETGGRYRRGRGRHRGERPPPQSRAADEDAAGADDLSDEPMPERPLELFGDNSGFGTERVELNGLRHVDPAVRDDDALPVRRAGGCSPVVTSRKKKGGFKTVYAFPFAEGEPPADDQLAGELRAAVDFINELLAEAADLSGYPFGAITALWMGVPEKGYSFTRVERVEQTVRADQRPHGARRLWRVWLRRSRVWATGMATRGAARLTRALPWTSPAHRDHACCRHAQHPERGARVRRERLRAPTPS